MSHPAYCDYICEKHDISYQQDICPLCYHEDDKPEICETHGLWVLDDEGCERCDKVYDDMLSQRELSQDGAR